MELIYVLGATTGLCVVLVLLLYIRQQKLEAYIHSTKTTVESVASVVRILQGNSKTQEEKLFELTSAVSGMSDKLQQLSRQNKEQDASLHEDIKKLQDKLQEVESADPGARMYTKAAKLVASGATLEDVMQECDLPRAEAELLMNLHTKG